MTVFQLPENTGVTLEYWIVCFPYYGVFVFYGSENEAREMLDKKSEWEKTRGTMRRADPDNKTDRSIVVQEIEAVRADRTAGVKNLPFLPSKGWF